MKLRNSRRHDGQHSSNTGVRIFTIHQQIRSYIGGSRILKQHPKTVEARDRTPGSQGE